MASIRKTLTTDIADANSIKPGVDYGQFEEITYYSKAAKHDKKANVLLPAHYDPAKKYPVMYVNHGIFGSHFSMADDSMGVRNISRNLAASGEAKEMIIVLTSMYTDPNGDAPMGGNITLDVTQKYDAIREDLIDSLMPYINEHYAALTGRENTAICGFSMGGRESLYVGITKPEYFGYIGAACPAPGVTPGKDGWMDHPGNMPESELKIKDAANQPYMLLLAGGTNDGVVGKFPQQYDQILTRNGQDHLWLEVPGGGHDGSVVAPMMYNFIRNVFKAG